MLIAIQRQNMGYILIGAHHDHAPGLTINAAHVEDVAGVFVVYAKDFFVVLQAEFASGWYEQRRHVFVGEFFEGLLKHSAQVDQAVNIFFRPCVLH